jgi:hypothetical protein
MNNLPRIYCDMDGVLCDFKTAAVRETGMPIDSWMNLGHRDKIAKWQPIVNNKRFWHTLPWQLGGQQLWSHIKNYEPHILSAYVEHATDPNCIPGKRYWAMTNLGLPSYRINLVKRREKQNFAQVNGEPAILIDDYVKNVNQFKARGGIGILHISAASSISQLKSLGFK